MNISDVVVHAKLSKSTRKLNKQPQKLKAAEVSICMTNRVGVGGSGKQRRQRGRCLARLSVRKLSFATNKKKKKSKKKKMKEKILKLKLFHHYKMEQEMFDLMNGDIMPHLCLLIMVILIVSTFGF